MDALSNFLNISQEEFSNFANKLDVENLKKAADIIIDA